MIPDDTTIGYRSCSMLSLPFPTTHCIGLRCLRLGLLKGHGTGSLPCWHLSARQPRGTVGAIVSLCHFFSPKTPPRTLREGPTVTSPSGFEVSALFREKLLFETCCVSSFHLQSLAGFSSLWPTSSWAWRQPLWCFGTSSLNNTAYILTRVETCRNHTWTNRVLDKVQNQSDVWLW